MTEIDDAMREKLKAVATKARRMIPGWDVVLVATRRLPEDSGSADIRTVAANGCEQARTSILASMCFTQHMVTLRGMEYVEGVLEGGRAQSMADRGEE